MKILKSFTPRILVIGDLMIDHYLWGNCERISPEAPVQIVDISKETTVLGGGGNVVNNLVALGAKVSVSGVIGNDENGVELLKLLREIDVNVDNIVIQEGRKTSKKSRVIAASQQILRYDKESKEEISKSSIEVILNSLAKDISRYDAVVLSDYSKGVLTKELCQGVISTCSKNGIKVLVDPKGSDYSKYSGAYLLTPNKKEAIQATKIDIKDKQSLKEALLKMKKDANLAISLITLSEDGVAIYDDEMKIFPTVAKEVFDVTGAGDTVIASIAFAISAGKSIEESAKFANLAAGVVVGKIGSATVSISEIEEYEASLHKSTSDAHIKGFEEIEAIVKRYKESGKKVVFTNGCFDILHVGHVKYLQIAKSFGDVLIVGLNSDTSVTRLKGPSRPVNIAEDRAYLLAALEAVDFVVPFEDDTPYELIKMIKPDTLVKGGDYEGKSVIGTEFAQELKLVDFVDGKSTTKTIQKIKGDLHV
ncbi:D-beta-D-heptose 1-phosphate adenylyltransferase / D-alpha,beta-D-heptose 7-phosphate 1-kinase [Sulfurimonas denitrificans DSM 1251]|uniref:Bifunctional protein HldE n=1 Tax=Sulfurimonas denitrificans (strain ATCC 33889 / DSM 1251) TaxID=326298 RepID=HLDE_SULDN|nr:D-glycero-beta-D-manno-heptose-7-phosphate kinase [Sulfurimonas denitrificans]Q30T22.1 RecName: Full=Bifunctional protein HldE; Includes: RecName: Full=D-beta-D-heptose 7-phosphate kinase; AltName: Full=D-beta-D-heptose 7-phosphotransferase; AltName: Full=D-glycero-beta-D-manno-heptose-7-phosphate kinase; Includes: RecName: Full=D-beta-D-heptose 1-phosphate adenylyltransferase; AltName: Full=D-glycero-beta-D-manno-heptose 1-phosphate adenylyltransferase [Sulfurimonas denitrificans DSM 1251]ABB